MNDRFIFCLQASNSIIFRNPSAVFVLAAFLLLTGFRVDNAIVPEEEILSGVQPKDGIPAILKPEFWDERVRRMPWRGSEIGRDA